MSVTRARPPVRRWIAGAAALAWPLRMAAVGALVLAAVWLAVPGPRPAPSLPRGVTRPVSGLAARDPLVAVTSLRSLQDRYVFNGSAPPAAAYESEGRHGLVVGVAPHRGWRGWFGVTLNGLPADAYYHVRMAPPATVPSSGIGEEVFAVQTALTQRSGAINYVVVAAVTRDGVTHWDIGYAHGLIADASTRIFWRGPTRRGLPAAQDITLRTDGRSCLAVWLGRRRAFAGCGLRLDIPAPYQAYLEVQARDIGYSSTFTDFWVARARPIRVTGAAGGSRVALIAPTGEPIAAARASSTGEATLAVPPPRASGTASLEVAGRRRGPLRYSTGDRLTWSSAR